tara:strand:- start:1038 stop:1214 length:177 start_codon:yes stop_codon:yes gene_type:complete
MSKSSIVTAIYIVGLIIGALLLDIWGAENGPRKALIGAAWTAIFLIALFYTEKKNNKN